MKRDRKNCVSVVCRNASFNLVGSKSDRLSGRIPDPRTYCIRLCTKWVGRRQDHLLFAGHQVYVCDRSVVSQRLHPFR